MKYRFFAIYFCLIVPFFTVSTSVFAQTQTSTQSSVSLPQTGTTIVTTDVLIIGGGASGITAGIQAARMGAKVIIIEETAWLGGMLTSAGVGAIDGNNNLPSGLWGEFRQKLHDYYGGAKNVETGWVSNTLFEPHIGDSVWKAMAAKEASNLSIYHGYKVISLEKNGKRISLVRCNSLSSTATLSTLNIAPTLVIDATETGDILALSGTKYDVGMENRTITGEECAPTKANDIIQDLTWIAVLKDYRVQLGDNADRRIPKPANYDPKEFDGSCKESAYSISADSASKLVDAQKMLDYGRIPTTQFLRTGKGAKYMLNWPRMGNDYYFNSLNASNEERLREFNAAKQKTLRFVYHIQTTLGFKYLGLPDDEFPTPDSLALIPYHREGRRLQGMVRMTVNHALKPYSDNLYKTAIAVGDYPVDHHHAKYPKQSSVPVINFPAIPSFSIPLGALIPKEEGKTKQSSNQAPNLIAAEKCISVSNIMNGSTRLQPCVMLIGQAAGTLAALASKSNISPSQVPVRSVQQSLLDSKCWLLPYLEIQPDSRYFQPVQKMGLLGAMQGTGIPNKWANQTWFYPDYTMTHDDFLTALTAVLPNKKAIKLIPPRFIKKQVTITVPEALTYLRFLRKEIVNGTENKLWELFDNNTQFLIRRDCALLLDMAFQPFQQSDNIDHRGNSIVNTPAKK